MCAATIIEPKQLVSAWRPLWVALTVTALVTAFRMTGTVDSDVAWQLWIAQRMHAGANLYRDIIETNPPLWFWMAAPVERLSAFLDVRPEPVLVIFIGALVGLSLVATDRLIRHIGGSRRALFLGYAALVLAAVPWMHVGQREQIVLIGTLPYAALINARRDGAAVPTSLAVAIGVGAALGFALKQYFLIVPAALELWLLAGRGKSWRPLRPEIIALVAVGIVYAAAIFLFERTFLTTIVPLIRLAYGVFGAPSIRYMFGPFAILGLTILAVGVTQIRLMAGRRAPLGEVLLVSAAAFGAVYFVQLKGWPYHALPLIGFASLALAALLAETSKPSAILRVAGPTLLALPLFLSAEEQLNPALPSPDMRAALNGLTPGDTVAFLTTETAVPWSVTLQGRYRYASRYNGYWMMRAIIRNELAGSPDPRLTDLGRRIVNETVSDFTCTPPRRIFVSRPRPGEDGFDILPFFLRDPHFGELLSHYRVLSRTSLETYQVATPLHPPAQPCRQGV
jgi:hypothetical protein